MKSVAAGALASVLLAIAAVLLPLGGMGHAAQQGSTAPRAARAPWPAWAHDAPTTAYGSRASQTDAPASVAPERADPRPLGETPALAGTIAGVAAPPWASQTLRPAAYRPNAAAVPVATPPPRRIPFGNAAAHGGQVAAQ